MESFDGQRPGIVVETNETKGNDLDEHLSVNVRLLIVSARDSVVQYRPSACWQEA